MSNIRWGIKYTSDPTKDANYLQEQLLEDCDFARRGELFLNEPRKAIYYKDNCGKIQTLSTTAGTFYLREGILDEDYYIKNKEKLVVSAPTVAGLQLTVPGESDVYDEYYFWIINNSSYPIYINPRDGETIEGTALFVLNPNDRSLIFQKIGSDWRIISQSEIILREMNWKTPPVSSSSPGSTGDVAYDNDYFYVCIDTDTWHRASLEAW